MYYKAFFLILIVMTIGLIPSFAFAEESDHISTNLDTYSKGENVIVFGKILNIVENLPLTIQIYHGDNLVEVAQISVGLDGSFADSFIASGPLWSSEGSYTVRGFYTSDQIMETTFQFINTVVTNETSTFSVNIPNAGVFDLPYTIMGGQIDEITLDKNSYSILIDTTIEANGSLTLQLPRDSFDSKKDNGADDIFIILIKDKDGDIFEALYEEIENTDNFRMIKIILEPGDELIEIIGTYVIPEFGNIVIIILIVAITSTIIISKSRLSLRYN